MAKLRTMREILEDSRDDENAHQNRYKRKIAGLKKKKYLQDIGFGAVLVIILMGMWYGVREHPPEKIKRDRVITKAKSEPPPTKVYNTHTDSRSIDAVMTAYNTIAPKLIRAHRIHRTDEERQQYVQSTLRGLTREEKIALGFVLLLFLEEHPKNGIAVMMFDEVKHIQF